MLKLPHLIEDHCFDIRYGVDTCGWEELDGLTIDSDNKKRGYMYVPARVRPLRKLLGAIKPMIPVDSVLVDFGCGKGRVLLVASEFGFREARGVESAHELCEIARKNTDAYKSKAGREAEYRIIESDAANYAVSTDESVFFFFNPFDDTIMTTVLSNIAASLQNQRRRILIIYYNAKFGSTIEKREDFVKLRELSYWGHSYTLYTNCD